MLIIDDNMYKLAKMQESLLKVNSGDKHSHLESYIKTVTDIDAKAFKDLVSLIKDADKYNQTLEDELVYLDKIKVAYDQLLELQLKFKKVCEENGNDKLVLSDMSQLNIEYIEDRISAINGYLVNIKNIDQNKRKLELLNEQLVDEEKKREFLNKKVLVLERKLKESFLHATIRQVVFGKLQTFNMVNEYEKIGYDLNSLIENEEVLNIKFKNSNLQLMEMTEKYETAKVCHSNLFNVDSRHIIEDIEKEFYNIKYKYVMLKILKLLVSEVNNYELARVKRRELVELLNTRELCLVKINIKNPLNILELIGLNSQIEELDSLAASVETIRNIRSQISNITFKTEDMINQNNDYLISLSDTKEMIKSNIGMNDFDITTFDDIVEEEVKSKEIVLNNQVVRVSSIPSNFKYNIAIQKARGVIERICKINVREAERNRPKKGYTPELVIGPKEKIVTKEKSVVYVIPDIVVSKQNKEIEKEAKVDEIKILEPVDVILPVVETSKVDNSIELEDLSITIDDEPIFNEVIDNDVVEKPVVEEVIPVQMETYEKENNNVKTEIVDTNIFETAATPFSEPVFFSEKFDNGLVDSNQVNVSEPVNYIEKEVQLLPEMETLFPDLGASVEEEVVAESVMPDAFWITEPIPENTEEKVELSFEEQINALLAETNNESVVRRR